MKGHGKACDSDENETFLSKYFNKLSKMINAVDSRLFVPVFRLRNSMRAKFQAIFQLRWAIEFSVSIAKKKSLVSGAIHYFRQ